DDERGRRAAGMEGAARGGGGTADEARSLWNGCAGAGCNGCHAALGAAAFAGAAA
ncbi:unnamed protein product, partial [Symbiodinium pilosum]